jgi:hypothetical protein
MSGAGAPAAAGLVARGVDVQEPYIFRKVRRVNC